MRKISQNCIKRCLLLLVSIIKCHCKVRYKPNLTGHDLASAMFMKKNVMCFYQALNSNILKVIWPQRLNAISSDDNGSIF